MRSGPLLAVVLRVVGAVEAAALAAVVMPRGWMDAIGAAAGVGALPPGPLPEYLARTASFLYGAHGVLLWFVAADVERYRPLIVFTAVAYLVSAAVLLHINFVSGMPTWWTVIEPAACVVVGGLILTLSRRREPD